jgi:diacylglycerol kinase (ATP)
LGLLPLGTAKDFARTLMIPADLERACETGTQGKVVDVDLGLTGEDYYVNVASVGLGAEVTQALSSQMKRAAGALAYPLAAIKAFFSHKPFSATSPSRGMITTQLPSSGFCRSPSRTAAFTVWD